MERLLRKGYEVLYMTDAVDEYCMEALTEYEGKQAIREKEWQGRAGKI